MTKKYKIREEVSADGISRFYVMSKEGWFGSWGYEEKWKDLFDLAGYRTETGSICKYNLEDAQAEIELLKKEDADYLGSKILKVKYHD